MLRHYLRTTLRVLGRNASFSAINLTGLSVGIASAFLLLLFVQNEVTFDRQHERADRIYRAWVQEDYGEDQKFFNTITPVPLGPAMEASIPEVEATARFDRITWPVHHGSERRSEDLHLVDAAFLSIFDFGIREGDAGTMLATPERVVLSVSAAKRYFGDSPALGQVLTVDFADQSRQFQVSGVLEDPPENSSLQFDFLLSYQNTTWYYPPRVHQAWFNVSAETYVLLREGADPGAVEAKLPAMVASVLGDRVQPGQYTVGIQPLLDIHMNPDFPQGFSTVISPAYVQILLAIAILILSIACINFVTLSMSRSLGRAKEIGVRKVIGADRTQLMMQYWGEALLLTGASVILGVVLAGLALPTFNQLAQRTLVFDLDGGTAFLILILFLAAGGLAGIYPALILSRFSPVDAFRGRVGAGGDRSLTRRSLVVVQFALSILLIASTLAIGRQLDYLRSKDLGFNRESVLTIPTGLGVEDGRDLLERLRFRTRDLEEVRSISGAAALFDSDGWPRLGYRADDGSYRRFFFDVVDEPFAHTMGLRVVAGRNFSLEQPGDALRGVLVNEALVAAYGWSEPLTERLPGPFDDHQIIGVVEDFHFASLHTAIEPAVLVVNPDILFSGAQDIDYSGSMAMDVAVRLATADLPATIDRLRGIWSDIAPDQPFSYSFVDQDLEAQYRQEARLGRMVDLGAILSILIAGLGLFGLAAISVARRSKEIGLRKVLGASVSGIVSLFAREFGILVGVAFLVAVPLAWLGIHQWMEGFAYRAPAAITPFLTAGGAAGVIMLIAVASQALRAAWSNPVDALRDE